MSKIFKEFQEMYSNGEITIVTTDFIYLPFFKYAYDEFKHIVKKGFLEDKHQFVVRACLENEVALNHCWKQKLIGLRPIDDETPFTSKEYNNWKDLIKLIR